MKLVVFGLAMSSSWGNGHATLWRSLAKGLALRGHSLTFFERDVPYYSGHRDLWALPGGRLVIYEDWERARAEASSALRDADVGIVTSYCPDAIGATELMLGSSVGLRVFYDLDTPVTLVALDAGEDVPYVPANGLGDFDLVLSFTGGKALGALKSRLHARDVAPLYGSVDPEVHRPSPPKSEFIADLSYLGTYSADRQVALEQLFVEAASRCKNGRFLLGGSQYPANFPWKPNLFYMPHVAPPDHPAFFCSSPVTVNVTRAPMVQYGYCPSGRLFEAAACGTPVLSDRWEGMDAFFESGREVLLSSSIEETLEVLARPRSELARIGDAARRRALAEHSGFTRSGELVALLTGASASRAGEMSLRSTVSVPTNLVPREISSCGE